MKQLYKTGFPVVFAKSNPAGLTLMQRNVSGKCYRFLVFLLLLISPILVSATNFKSIKNGNWDDPATWSTTGEKFPVAGDNVTIAAGTVVTITAAAACASVTLEKGNSQGQPKTAGGVLAIGLTGTNVELQTVDFTFIGAGNNGMASEETPTLTMLAGGKLKVSGTLKVDGSSGSSKISTGFAPGSTIEYNGTDQKILTNGSTFVYQNLILSGNGTKTISGALTVNENFTVTESANFVANPTGVALVHTVTGNMTVTGSAVYNGNTSTMNVAGSVTNNALLNLNSSVLSVGKDFVNSGTTDGGAASQVTVAKNWLNSNVFTPGTSTVRLTGAAAVTDIEIGLGAPTTFNVLYVEKDALMTNNITIISSLSLLPPASPATCILKTGTGSTYTDYKQITLAENASILTQEVDNSYIKGRVITRRKVADSAVQGFGNIGLNISRNNVDPGYIEVERVTGLSLSSADGTETSVPRYFDVWHVGPGVLTDLELTMDFSFLPMEIPPSIDNYVLVREVSAGKYTRPKATKLSTTTVRNINSGVFTRYTLANRLAPLPVDLVWFKAEPKGSDVLLTWQTAWELENAGFEVQLSEDGKVFRKVGFVQTGSPTKTGAQTYSFLHNDFRGTGTRYYRLAQHDLDGTVNYSMLRSVEVRNEGTFSVYPNPFINELTVVLPTDEPCEVVLTNHLGKQVYSAAAGSSQHSIKLDTPLQNGVYFLSIQTENNTYTRKLIKR